MAPQRLNIPELTDPRSLAELYAQYTIPEMAERLGCSINTIRNRMKEFNIKARNGAVSSLETRIEKAQAAIDNILAPFDPTLQAMLLRPTVEDLGGCFGETVPVCRICLEKGGRHRPWCSVYQRQEVTAARPLTTAPIFYKGT